MIDNFKFFYANDTEVMNETELQSNFEKYKTGDLKTRYNIIKSNIGLVISSAVEYVIDGYELEELLSIGSIGLIKAVDTYDITSNVKFLIYARDCINNEILINIKRKKIKCSDIDSNTSKDLKNRLDETFLEDFLCIMDSLSLEEIDAMRLYYGLDNYSYNQVSENFNMSKLAFLKLISNVLQKIKNKITNSDSLEDFIKKINKK